MKRTIFQRSGTTLFSINTYGEDAIYRAAMRLPRARWNEGRVIVPAEEWISVEDFAEYYGYDYSDGARRLLQQVGADMPETRRKISNDGILEDLMDEP